MSKLESQKSMPASAGHRLQSRLDALRTELAKGQTRLREVEREAAYLRETLLRISGAIQVLEELLAEAEAGRGEAGEAEGGPPSPAEET
jgi:predicted nuclease with TOPRIM domain